MSVAWGCCLAAANARRLMRCRSGPSCPGQTVVKAQLTVPQPRIWDLETLTYRVSARWRREAHRSMSSPPAAASVSSASKTATSG